MRKVMLLAAIMAMVLAAAAPAFAQAVATTDNTAGAQQYEQGQQNDQQSIVQDSICVNVQQAAANQYESGDQAAAAETGDVIGDTNAAANASNIANALGISAEQVNQCLNQVNSAAPGATVVATAPGTAPAGTAAPAPGGGGTAAAAPAATAAAGGALPPTGGASLLAIGAGALLVAGGLLARRIVR